MEMACYFVCCCHEFTCTFTQVKLIFFHKDWFFFGICLLKCFLSTQFIGARNL